MPRADGPNLFVVGAPKCGTTWMHELLRSHPDIFMTANKEPNHYSPEYAPNGWTYLDVDAYHRLFSHRKHESWAGESTPWYLYSPTALRRLSEDCEHAHVIIMLRNPVDMIHALHNELVYQGIEEIPDVGKAVRTPPRERRRGKARRSPHAVDGFLEYVQLAHYDSYVRAYLDTFGSRAHVVLFDDLKRDPSRVSSRIFDFLDVAPRVLAPPARANASKRRRSHRIAQLVRDPPDSVLRAGRAFVPRPLRPRLRAGARRLDQTLNHKKAPRAPMPSSLQHELQNTLRPEIEKLERTLGRDLESWK